MNRIIVFNVAAEHGGALTILQEFYEDAIKDKDKEWHIILSIPQFESKGNVKVYNYPWVKKSWLHRLFFELFVAPTIVRKLKVDEILSLQNILIPFVREKQTIYFHQPLPFAKKKFAFTDQPRLWVYQNIIGKLIIKSLRQANQVIVQTQWIKNMFIDDYQIDKNKILIYPPKINLKVNKKFETAEKNGIISFFYPSSDVIYKNHHLLVDAAEKLVANGFKEFEILLTLDGEENDDIKELKNRINKSQLPIKFGGKLTLDEVYYQYTHSILLFPSYIETYGLPLLEAKLHETPIIVSDLEYAREVLVGYDKVKYIDPFNPIDLIRIIENKILSLRKEKQR